MDIVPILTVTILAVTILTLILSVFAYVLYKLKERKNNHRNNNHKVASETQQTTVQKEIVVIPASAGTGPVKEGTESRVEKSAPEPALVKKEEETTPLFWRYTPKGYVPVSERRMKVGEHKWR